MSQPQVNSDETQPEELFNVVYFYDSGDYHYEHRHIPAERAMQSVKFAIGSVAAKMRVLTRVLITDMLDCTCLEWKLDEGIVFPPVDLPPE